MRDILKRKAEKDVEDILRNQTCTINQRKSYIMAIVKLAYEHGKQDAMNKPGRWG